MADWQTASPHMNSKARKEPTANELEADDPADAGRLAEQWPARNDRLYQTRWPCARQADIATERRYAGDGGCPLKTI
jgi:hypothetical protein